MSQVARATRFVEGCGSDRPQLMRAVVMFHLRERHHVEQLVSQIARLAPTRDRRYYGAVNRLPQDLVKDIMIKPKFALRTLFKTPFVTVIAIVSLALGIGANAAIFSCFNQMLLQSLPVPEPAQLVNLAAPGPKPGSQIVQPGRRLRRGLQLRDVPRPAEGADGVHRHRRAPAVRRQPVVSRARR